MIAFSNKGMSFSRRTSLVLTYAIPAMLSTTDLRTFQIGSFANFKYTGSNLRLKIWGDTVRLRFTIDPATVLRTLNL